MGMTNRVCQQLITKIRLSKYYSMFWPHLPHWDIDKELVSSMPGPQNDFADIPIYFVIKAVDIL